MSADAAPLPTADASTQAPASPAAPPSSPVPDSAKPKKRSQPSRKAASKSKKSCTTVACAALTRCACGAILDHSGHLGVIQSAVVVAKKKAAAKKKPAPRKGKGKSAAASSAAPAAADAPAADVSAGDSDADTPDAPMGEDEKEEKKTETWQKVPVLLLAKETTTMLKALRENLQRLATGLQEAYGGEARDRISRALGEPGRCALELAHAGKFDIEVELMMGVKLLCDMCKKDLLGVKEGEKCVCKRREKFEVHVFEDHATAGFSDLPEDASLIWRACGGKPKAPETPAPAAE